MPPTSFHLRGGGALTSAAPSVAEAAPLFQHRVNPAYDLITYVQDHASENPSRLAGNMSRVVHTFETAPLPRTAEIFGRVHVELVVDETTGTTQLSVDLAHVEPNGTAHHITFGTGGMRGAGAGRHTLAFDLGDIVHVVPAGNRLRATLMDVALHRPPSYQRIRFAPYFTDTDTTIVIEPGAASRIDVPLRPFTPTLTRRHGLASAAAGIDHRMAIDGDAARAEWPYVVFVGASGEAPGITVPGLPHVALNLDAWTSLGIALQNTAAFPVFAGNLDANGRASPALRVPAGAVASSMIGLRLTFAGLAIGPGFVAESALGPATLVIDP